MIRPRSASTTFVWSSVTTDAWSGETNQPTRNISSRTCQIAVTAPVSAMRTATPTRPIVMIAVGGMRAAIAPIMPAARIIDALWAMSSGPNHAGLTTRTRVINGTNRTLTAPRPSMTTASEAIVVERSREWATRERPRVRLREDAGRGRRGRRGDRVGARSRRASPPGSA